MTTDKQQPFPGAPDSPLIPRLRILLFTCPSRAAPARKSRALSRALIHHRPDNQMTITFAKAYVLRPIRSNIVTSIQSNFLAQREKLTAAQHLLQRKSDSTLKTDMQRSRAETCVRQTAKVA
jgi:hypothetical protein